jgi:hypothetical protein
MENRRDAVWMKNMTRKEELSIEVVIDEAER